MPNQLTPEQRREYQRAYREKKSQEKQETQATPELESKLHRNRTESTWINPFEDGLPDTGYLIQRLTQKQRDEILDKINRGSSR